jgi:Tfp pilus assembly protein PilF
VSTVASIPYSARAGTIGRGRALAGMCSLTGAMLAMFLCAESPDARAAGSGTDAAIVDADYQAAMDAVKKQDWPQAVVRMSAYAQRHPESADAWNELCHAQRKTGDLDSASKDYARAL